MEMVITMTPEVAMMLVRTDLALAVRVRLTTATTIPASK